MTQNDGFYEDDESLDKVQAAFAQGPHGVTLPPSDVSQQLAWMPTRAANTSRAAAPINVRFTPAVPAQKAAAARN